MARPRTLPDSEVFAAILRLIAAEGEKAVAFSAVARVTGLAGASLVQRYGALPQMVEAALSWGWDELDAMLVSVEAEAALAEHASGKAGHKSGSKGPQGLLKVLGDKGSAPMAALMAASLRHASLRQRAADWRGRVEAMLATRLRDPEAAAMIFAAWQGQVLWESLGARGFRLKDLLKKLT